jgi:signal transduction histidine kinase/CheY-like chemotaxis protein
LAFTAMVSISYAFTREIVLEHLERESRDTLEHMELRIEYDFKELETLLSVISESVSGIINNGFDTFAVTSYMNQINNHVLEDKSHVNGYVAVFGVFDVFDGRLFNPLWDDVRLLDEREGFVPQEQPWYRLAEEANGAIIITEPYDDSSLGIGENVIAFARCIYDDEGNKLATIGIYVMLDRIQGVTGISGDDIDIEAYAVLLDKELTMIAHPITRYVGIPLDAADGEFVELAEILRHGDVSNYIINYEGERFSIYTRHILNDWVLASLVSYDRHYSSVGRIQLVLCVTGFVLAVILSLLLIRIHSGKIKVIQELQEADERAQTLLDATPLAANLWTKDYNNIYTNEASAKLFGLSDKQDYLNKFAELSPENQPDGKNSAEEAVKLIKKAFKDGYCRFEWVHHNLKGEPIPVEVTLVRVKFKNEYHVTGFTRDLRKEKEMLSLMMLEDYRTTSASLGIAQWDMVLTNGDVTNKESKFTTSKEMRALLGYSEGDYFGTGIEAFTSLLHPDDLERSLAAYQAHVSDVTGQISYDIEYRMMTKQGQYRYYRSRAIAQRDASGVATRVVGLLEDITETIRLRNELIAAKELAEQNDRSKSVFLANMSHEIRTPMNAILGMAEIQMQNHTIPKDTADAMNLIYDSGHLLVNIINDILDSSKIEAGKMEITPVKYDIPSLINDTVQLTLLRHESKTLKFNLEIEENTPLDLFGDELRIKQVLNNVLSNAFKYTEEGSVTLAVSSEPTDEFSNFMLIMKVSDTGQGMTPEQLNTLFDEYTRFNLDSNRTTVGTGLGMSITKRLLDMMNGEIHVESEPGKGTVFTIRIPQKRVGTITCGNELAKQMQRRHYTSTTRKTLFLREYMPYGKVLIVDDVVSNLYVAKGLLLPYGLQIETAESGFDAIKKIKNGDEYDIVFMDHMMPLMDGIETTKKLREMGYERSIIALTANAVTGQAEMFMKNGFDGFISKPIDSRELNASLNRLIRDKCPPEILEAARRERVETPIKLNIAEAVIKDTEKAIHVLENLFEKNNFDNTEKRLYTTTVHGMKSALLNIGELQLSKMAEKLERAGKEWDFPTISFITPGFIDSLKSVAEKLIPRVTSDAAEQIFNDDDFLHRKLRELKSACEKFNKNSARKALNELKEKNWSPEIKNEIDSLAEFLLHSKFAKIVETVNNLLS